MDVNQLGALGLVIVVASIILSLGASIDTSLATQQCTDAGKTWVGTALSGTSTVNNPSTSAKYGCCTTYNTTDCTNWYTASAALNVSHKGLAGLVTFGNWIPLIALVLVAAIVIGIIVTYLGRAGGGV